MSRVLYLYSKPNMNTLVLSSAFIFPLVHVFAVGLGMRYGYLRPLLPRLDAVSCPLTWVTGKCNGAVLAGGHGEIRN